MSADVLRQAAALMRERAEAASTGPYVAAEQTHDQWFGLQTPYAAIGNVFDCHDAEHIASWHPAVALAVADWLERVARTKDRCNPWQGWWLGDYDAALAVATVYLGADPAP